MKKALIILILIIIAIPILLVILGRISKSGKAEGVVNGTLLKCPDKPNCVCSEQKEDTDHYIDPIILSRENIADTLNILKEAIQESGGVIQIETDTYLSAIFTSPVFGFTDDFEARVDSTQNVIHIRSASRVGHSDLGANKKRTESLKALFLKKVN